MCVLPSNIASNSLTLKPKPATSNAIVS